MAEWKEFVDAFNRDLACATIRAVVGWPSNYRWFKRRARQVRMRTKRRRGW